MKKIQFTPLVFVTGFTLLLCMGRSYAQDCEAYFPMKSGVSFDLTHYDTKDKVTSITSTTITDESHEGGTFMVKAHAEVKDAKGKETGKMDYDVTCKNGEFHMDMRSFSFGQQQQQIEGMQNVEINVEAEDMVFPKGLAVGASLPDASLKMTAGMSGMTIMNMSVHVTNRKVAAKENLSTPAGNFSCIVIEEDIESHTLGMNIKGHNKTWYSLGVGMVRQESSRNGKLDSYSLLTKISGN